MSKIPENATKVFQGEIFSVWQWEQKLYDGSTATFEALKRQNTATVIGVLRGEKILLVWDEQPHRGGELTTAGGRIEEGEDPEEAGRRELVEETGYKAGNMKLWFKYNASGKIDWTVYVYIAKDLQKNGETHLDPGEKIEVREYTFDEFIALGSDAQFRDKECRMRLLEAQLDPKKKAELKKLLFGA